MTAFKIKITSSVIYGLTRLIIMFSGMFIGVYLTITKANDVYFFILILLGLGALVYVPNWRSA